MCFVGKALLLVLVPTVVGDQTQTVMDAFCQGVGAGNADIPGDQSLCGGVQHAQSDEDELICVGDNGNFCNKNRQLLAVRRSMEVLSEQGPSKDLQALLDDHCNLAGIGDDVEVGGDSHLCTENLFARRASGSWTCAEPDFRFNRRRRRVHNSQQCVFNNGSAVICSNLGPEHCPEQSMDADHKGTDLDVRRPEDFPECPEPTTPNSAHLSRCERNNQLLIVIWTFNTALNTASTDTITMATTTSTTTAWILPFHVPYCTPPAVRFFNRGECFTDCPEYEQEVDIDGERVCLPTATHQAGRMSDSSLEARTKGVGVELSLAYPLLPLKFAENISISFTVDMKEQLSELYQTPACDKKWQRQILDDQLWEPDNVKDWDGHQVRGNFSSGERVVQRFLVETGGDVQPNTRARVSVSLIFFGALDKENDDDAISLAVNGVQREVYWPTLGRTHQEDKLIYRQHVCQRAGSFTVPSDHCKGQFYFEVESDEDGNLTAEFIGSESSTEFSWAFYNFTVELPFMSTTLGYADLSGACQLGTAVVVDQHLERPGSVGVSVIGTWKGTDGSMTEDELYRLSWPVRILFPAWVAGSYDPFEVWEPFLGDEVTQKTEPFVGRMQLFEREQYVTEKRVPRYEQNSIGFARHCLVERGLGLKLLFRQLYLSTDEDATNTAAFVSNLTDDVTVYVNLNSDDEEEECVYFSFVVPSQPCEWCRLHVFSVVRPVSRRLSHGQQEFQSSPMGGHVHREFDSPLRRLDSHVQPEVHSRSSQQEGYAVNNAMMEVGVSDAASGANCLTAATVGAIMSLAVAVAM